MSLSLSRRRRLLHAAASCNSRRLSARSPAAKTTMMMMIFSLSEPASHSVDHSPPRSRVNREPIGLLKHKANSCRFELAARQFYALSALPIHQTFARSHKREYRVSASCRAADKRDSLAVIGAADLQLDFSFRNANSGGQVTSVMSSFTPRARSILCCARAPHLADLMTNRPPTAVTVRGTQISTPPARANSRSLNSQLKLQPTCERSAAAARRL